MSKHGKFILKNLPAGVKIIVKNNVRLEIDQMKSAFINTNTNVLVPKIFSMGQNFHVTLRDLSVCMSLYHSIIHISIHPIVHASACLAEHRVLFILA